ncbi:MAG: hypothetical protein ACFFD4_00795 [Candidatus Odinarchaeota archaeon]
MNLGFALTRGILVMNKLARSSTRKNGQLLATGDSVPLRPGNVFAHDVAKNPVHYWYTIVAGFSGDFIRQNLERHGIQKDEALLDPFMGTGTAALTGMFSKLQVYGIDANPFTHFVANVKTDFDIDSSQVKDHYRNLKKRITNRLETTGSFSWKKIPTTDIKDHLKAIWKNRADNGFDGSDLATEPPAMPHLKRWLSPRVLAKVLTLKSLLNSFFTDNTVPLQVQDFFKLAFASVLLPVSNVKRAGPKISYRRKGKERILCIDAPVYRFFTEKLEKMISDLDYFSRFIGLHRPELHFGSSTEASKIIGREVDIVLSSPPYLNEVDYLDNTRLELYFLDFIKNDKDLRVLKEFQIRGNSKYLFSSNRDYPDNLPGMAVFEYILEVCREIEKVWEKKNYGWDHPRLVAEYFVDMSKHLGGVQEILKEGGKYVFIVGDSALDGVHVPTDRILAEIALETGFSRAGVQPFRKRGSSRHGVQLRESIVTMTN